MLAHCFNPQLMLPFIVCNKPRACAVFRLASTAVNQNEERFKYHFYTASDIQIS